MVVDCCGVKLERVGNAFTESVVRVDEYLDEVEFGFIGEEDCS